MSTVEDFGRAWTELQAAAGVTSIDGVVRSGALEIRATVGAGELEVSLAGWSRKFGLGDDEDGADAAALALDLLGAALFGALRVAVDSYAGRPRRYHLQLRDAAGWRTIDTQGDRPWNPLARASTRLCAGDRVRPPQYAAREVVGVPWAAWAGICGFYGAELAAAPSELPVDGELDLHNFHPREVKPLVLAYIDECLARGLTELRIVHGKGIGNLRRTVHALLERHPRVRGFRLGGHGAGGWGATIVDLSPGTDH